MRIRPAGLLAVFGLLATSALLAGSPGVSAEPDGVRGHLDGAQVGDDGSIAVHGWAYDPATPTAALDVHIYVNGEPAASLTADGDRPDLTFVLGITPNHGFVTSLEGHSGPLTVCAVALDTLLGCINTTAHLGMLVTPTDVVVPVVSIQPDGWLVTTPCGKTATVPDGTWVTSATVVLDPGHGGSQEPGAVAPNGIVERDLNLAVALEVERLLAEQDVDVVLTRRSNSYMVPLQHRADIANSLQAELLVSIHHNGGTTQRITRPGTEVYAQHANPGSHTLAALVYEELSAAAARFPTDWVGKRGSGLHAYINTRGEDFFGILRGTSDMASVIGEFLYMSNAPEAELLARPEVLEAEAQAYATAIVRWMQDDAPAEAASPQRAVVDYHSPGGGYAGCVDPDLQ